jgi:hypothetical protein
MNKSKLYLILRCIFLVSTGLIILSSCKPKELPTKLIRQEFKEIAGRELPQKAEGLRAIDARTRDPQIFVRFETDSEGIAEVLKTFGGPGVEIRNLDEDDFKRWKALGVTMFPGPSNWQETIGVKIFDQESFKSGRELDYYVDSRKPGYRIFIDDQQSIVYIYAFKLL